MANLEHILHFLDQTFDVAEFPDYPQAFNGLQVEGTTEIHRVVAAVDASARTIETAARSRADLLLVHHGIFWGGRGPITGRLFRKIAPLIRQHINLYSVHLPLDAHPDLGNNALLIRALGLEVGGRFGTFQEAQIGWWSHTDTTRDDLAVSLGEVLDGEIRVIPGGPERIEKLGVVSGGGGSALSEASAMGLDTLITGEAQHHTFHDAMELGVNLILGGHYATETFGVKAVAEKLVQEFGLDGEFVDFPTGL